MSYRAIIHDLSTGLFLVRCQVEAHDLHEAESAAITKAAVTTEKLPRDLEVRHLHECAQRAFALVGGSLPHSA